MRMEILIHGQPVTKKNSMRLVNVRGRTIPIPSKAYKEYEHLCMAQIPAWKRVQLDKPVNIKCEYWMGTRRQVDLLNLLGATMDILVAAGVIRDDNSRIVVSHDGSRVGYDKDDPRVLITITEGMNHEETEQGSEPGGTDADARGRADQPADR